MTKAKGFAKKYISKNYETANKAGDSLKNEVLQAVFTIFLKLSYALFSFGLVLSIQSGSLDQQRLVVYVQESQNEAFLVALVLLEVSIIAITREVNEENKIKPATKKVFNFIADILKTAFYVTALFFVEPFVFDARSDFLLYRAFWVFTIALVFFVLREFIKWYYYLGDGKNNLGPWESKNITDEDNVAKLTHLVDAYLIEKGLIDADKDADNLSKNGLTGLIRLSDKLKEKI